MNWTGPGLCQRHRRPLSDVKPKQRRVRVSVRQTAPLAPGSGFSTAEATAAETDPDDSGDHKLQALVYGILPPTTAVIDYAIGLGKTDIFSLVLKWQYVSVVTVKSNYIRRFFVVV